MKEECVFGNIGNVKYEGTVSRDIGKMQLARKVTILESTQRDIYRKESPDSDEKKIIIIFRRIASLY